MRQIKVKNLQMSFCNLDCFNTISEKKLSDILLELKTKLLMNGSCICKIH